MSLAEQETDPEGWVPPDSFADRLIIVRRYLELTQEEAAAKAEINPKTWATWELGTKPRAMNEVVDQIARNLGVSRAYLMWGVRTGSFPTPPLTLIPGGRVGPPEPSYSDDPDATRPPELTSV